MAEKQIQKKKVNKRDAIIQASADLFEQVGYHRASMQMLAEKVGLGKPTLYHYFKSKSEILYAIHQEVISGVLATHESRVVDGLAPDELLRGIAKDMITFIKDHPGYVRAFFEHFDELDENHQIEIRHQRNLYMKETMKVIDQGHKSGLFIATNPHVTALAFFGLINWSYKWLPSMSNMSIDETCKTLCDLFLNGLKT